MTTTDRKTADPTYWCTTTGESGRSVTTSTFQRSGTVRNRERRMRARVARAGWRVSKNTHGYSIREDCPVSPTSWPLSLTLDQAEPFMSWLAV
jgi:hypothetical protein